MDQSKEISDTFGTDTKKMKMWEDAIKMTIWSDWNKLLESNQIPVSMDKWEKELSKKRSINKD